MAKQTLTKDNVVEAIENIIDRGDKLTIEKVRTELGGFGSYTTLTKFVGQWREEHETEELPKPLPDVPEALAGIIMTALKQFVGKVYEESDQRIIDIERTAEAKVGETASELSYAKKEIERLEETLSETQSELSQLRMGFDNANRTIAGRDEKITILDQAALKHKAQADKATAEVVTLKERLTVAFEKSEAAERLTLENVKLSTSLDAVIAERDRLAGQVETMLAKLGGNPDEPNLL